MSKEPRILATFVQSSLEEMADLDAGVAQQVRERLKPDTLRTIEEASPISWLPVQTDVELTDCFFEIAGPGRATRAFRENMANSLHKPLLRPLVEGALGIFGRNPVKLMRWVPKGWSLIYRDCGEMKFAGSSEGEARIELEGLPQAIAGSRTYLTGTASTILAFVDFLDVTGQVVLEGPDPATGSAAFEIRW
jgi:hypothetical protein